MTDDREQTVDAEAPSQLAYEAPKLTRIGNLHDVLAAAVPSPLCDNSIGGGTGSGEDQC